MTAPYDLVLFDCDGVLVDSERITARVFSGMLRELGLDVTVEDVFDLFVGQSMDQCLALIADRWRRELSVSFVEEYRARSAAALESEVRPVPGIESVLSGLSIPFCVASNGTHEKMRTTLGVTGLLPYFSGRMFGIGDVERGKPAPDLYLHAAQRCGAEPARCAVIEDTPTGVRAGVAAGMTVFGFSALTPARRLTDAGAHRPFARMEDLPALLAGRG